MVTDPILMQADSDKKIIGRRHLLRLIGDRILYDSRGNILHRIAFIPSLIIQEFSGSIIIQACQTFTQCIESGLGAVGQV